MNILMSIRKPWTDKILDGSKPIEFRNNIGKLFKVDSTIYLYESKSNNGLGKVVGEFKIEDIVTIKKSKTGTYPFLLYYAENILKDEEIVKAVKEIYDVKLEHYNDSLKLYYIFDKESLNYIEKTDKNVDLLSLSKSAYKDYIEKQDRSRKLCLDCDNWLNSIGYYNEYGETFYKNYIKIKDYIKYEIPIELNNFKNQKGETITKAPQSWLYVK